MPVYFSGITDNVLGNDKMNSVHLPPGCPPGDAEACTGEIFRLVPVLPLNDKGFVSQFDLYPSQTWEDECMARGLSVRLSYESATRLRNRVRGLRKFKIVVACLETPVGMIRQTGSDQEHYTWWPEDGADLLSLFTVHASEAI